MYAMMNQESDFLKPKITIAINYLDLALMGEHKDIIQTIFSTSGFNFDEIALKIFRFQYVNNEVYQKYVDAIGVQPDKISALHQIPFLPIRFFKTHKVVSTKFTPQIIFESSGTTETVNSNHFVKEVALYEQSFMAGFKTFYGNIKDWCIIGLLPSYLERQNSSLVYMAEKLIKESGHKLSGFYLNDFDSLANALTELENLQQKTLLIGVTFALLDFAEAHPMPLKHITFMETGGMKGRKREMVKQEVHDILQKAFSVETIHSEYGMTELLSQAYSFGKGIFVTSPTMKVFIRDDEDPLTIIPPTSNNAKGLINIVDLANIYSCSFIATDDIGVLFPDGKFEVTGRRDTSDLRGCSLLAV